MPFSPSSTDAINRIRDLFIAKYSPAYISLDVDMRVIGFSDNIEKYGYKNITVGQQGEDQVEFLIGMDAETEIDLPLLVSPIGHPIAIKVLPNDDELTVFIMDAQQEYTQLELLQQKANEVELLSEKQNTLMQQLNLAKDELELKNESLKESSRLQSTFISGVSHEFRTPLSSIIGYASRIKLSELDSEQDQQIAVIQRSAKHLLSLVENLLDYGRVDSNELVILPRQVRLSEIIEDVYALMKPHAEIKKINFILNNQIRSELFVFVDETRLRQCLINLIGNAIKFTDEGRVEVEAQWSEEELVIKVVDTGPGITIEEIDKIFISFWQGDNPNKLGAGLGLTITKRLLELMGGDIQVEPSLGKGAQFLLSLPLPEMLEKVDQENNIESSITIKPSNFDILLVEDDVDISALVKLMLLDYGFKVELAENGEQAVKLVANKVFDAILMDINMPIMDGYTATQQIREQGYKKPILAMTASNVEADKARALDSGCDGYIIKPINDSELLSILNETLLIDEKVIDEKVMNKKVNT